MSKVRKSKLKKAIRCSIFRPLGTLTADSSKTGSLQKHLRRCGKAQRKSIWRVRRFLLMSAMRRFGGVLLLLTACRLVGNYLGDAGAKAIAQALRTNTTVRHIVLDGTSADESVSLLGEGCDLDARPVCSNLSVLELFFRIVSRIDSSGQGTTSEWREPRQLRSR